MAALFDPLRLRDVEFRNRAWVSPMCQYSSREGLANDWHLVHLGARAVGGAGLVMTEAAAVTPEGRISPQDLGLWSDAHAEALAPVAAFVAAQGAVPGVQLAHAGRKASTDVPWRGGGPLGDDASGWSPLGPSGDAFGGLRAPAAMTDDDLLGARDAFVAAARRAHAAGFRVVELHGAHGYLLHEFLSPLSNHRDDAWGGDRDRRMAFPLEVARAVREAWPAHLPLFVRVSATDWVEGGWTVDDTVAFARLLGEVGVDLVDVSSGGASPDQQIVLGPGYQVPFAERVRHEADVATGAVGLITEPAQADAIVTSGQADAVLLARALLRDPHWPLRAATALGAEIRWPDQYARARPR